MSVSSLAAALGRRNIHYGWVVVGATLFVTVITAAAMSTPGVLIVPLEQEFGWSDAQISSALAIRLMLFGLFGPFAAAFMNRYGVRAVVLSAVILISAGFLASLVMTQAVAACSAVGHRGRRRHRPDRHGVWRSRWRRAGSIASRGLVMGIFAASNATGQLVFLPLIASLATNYGWRMSLVFVCCMLAIAGVVALLLHARPAERRRPAALWRDRGHAAAAVGRRSCLVADVAVDRAEGSRPLASVLGIVRHLLCLRLQHERIDPDPFRLAVP